MAIRRRDWFPRTREGQLNMARTWITAFAVPGAGFEVSTEDKEALSELVGLLNSAEAESRSLGGGRVITGRLNDLYGELNVLMRAMHKVLTSRALSNESRAMLDLPPLDTTRTPIPTPTDQPIVEADTSKTGELTFYVFVKDKVHRGRPDGVAGIELVWDFFDTRPADQSLLTRVETVSANPILLKFRDEDRGKHVFYSGRWVNAKLQAGPWSDIESSVIP